MGSLFSLETVLIMFIDMKDYLLIVGGSIPLAADPGLYKTETAREVLACILWSDQLLQFPAAFTSPR